MWAKVLAVLRTSEFWVVLGMAIVEAVQAPVPPEAQLVGWLYVLFRVMGKVAAFVFPNGISGTWFKNDSVPPTPPPAVPSLVIGALVLSMLASPGLAQHCLAQIEPEPAASISWKDRTHVTVNGGAFYLTSGADWSGASLGTTVLYNFHPQLSAFAAYDHGFPVNDVDEHLNVWRAVGSLKVHPNAFLGFGYAWFDDDTEGGLVQLALRKGVAPRLDVAGVYAHIFSNGDVDDFEYLKVAVNYHLFGKE